MQKVMLTFVLAGALATIFTGCAESNYNSGYNSGYNSYENQNDRAVNRAISEEVNSLSNEDIAQLNKLK